MATTAIPADAGAPPKKSKMKMIIAIVLVVVLGGGGAGAWFMLKSNKAHAAEQAKAKHGSKSDAAEEESEGDGDVKAPVFFPIEPFTVNLLPDDDGARYIHVVVTLKMTDAKLKDRLNESMPEVRNRILLLLSNQHASDVQTLEGKQKLADDIRKALAAPFDEGGKRNKVSDVLFTDFVVQ
jgi:flagellar FliL protein